MEEVHNINYDRMKTHSYNQRKIKTRATTTTTTEKKQKEKYEENLLQHKSKERKKKKHIILLWCYLNRHNENGAWKMI